MNIARSILERRNHLIRLSYFSSKMELIYLFSSRNKDNSKFQHLKDSNHHKHN
jgi:hypothetical protein